MKKLLLSLGTAATIAAPLATTVACSSEADANNNITAVVKPDYNTETQMLLNDIPEYTHHSNQFGESREEAIKAVWPEIQANAGSAKQVAEIITAAAYSDDVEENGWDAAVEQSMVRLLGGTNSWGSEIKGWAYAESQRLEKDILFANLEDTVEYEVINEDDLGLETGTDNGYVAKDGEVMINDWTTFSRHAGIGDGATEKLATAWTDIKDDILSFDGFVNFIGYYGYGQEPENQGSYLRGNVETYVAGYVADTGNALAFKSGEVFGTPAPEAPEDDNTPVDPAPEAPEDDNTPVDPAPEAPEDDNTPEEETKPELEFGTDNGYVAQDGEVMINDWTSFDKYAGIGVSATSSINAIWGEAREDIVSFEGLTNYVSFYGYGRLPEEQTAGDVNNTTNYLNDYVAQTGNDVVFKSGEKIEAPEAADPDEFTEVRLTDIDFEGTEASNIAGSREDEVQRAWHRVDWEVTKAGLEDGSITNEPVDFTDKPITEATDLDELALLISFAGYGDYTTGTVNTGGLSNAKKWVEAYQLENKVVFVFN